MKALPPTGRLDAEAGVLLLVARVALRILPFPWVARTLGRAGAVAPPLSGADEARALACAAAVTRVAARLGMAGGRCLARAAALQWMLRRRRLAGTVCFGTCRDATQRFRFHAWVTLGAHCIGAEADTAWQVINTFAPPGVAAEAR